MKKINIDHPVNECRLDDLAENVPIFAKKGHGLRGMVAKIPLKGWIVLTGGGAGVSGYFESRRECIEDAAKYGYDFFLEDKP